MAVTFSSSWLVAVTTACLATHHVTSSLRVPTAAARGPARAPSSTATLAFAQLEYKAATTPDLLPEARNLLVKCGLLQFEAAGKQAAFHVPRRMEDMDAYKRILVSLHSRVTIGLLQLKPLVTTEPPHHPLARTLSAVVDIMHMPNAQCMTFIKGIMGPELQVHLLFHQVHVPATRACCFGLGLE
jgi:hypothetical protein